MNPDEHLQSRYFANSDLKAQAVAEPVPRKPDLELYHRDEVREILVEDGPIDRPKSPKCNRICKAICFIIFLPLITGITATLLSFGMIMGWFIMLPYYITEKCGCPMAGDCKFGCLFPLVLLEKFYKGCLNWNCVCLPKYEIQAVPAAI